MDHLLHVELLFLIRARKGSERRPKMLVHVHAWIEIVVKSQKGLFVCVCVHVINKYMMHVLLQVN